MKIVINKCYGGFGLSDLAMKEYAKLKGIKLYPEKDKAFSLITYYTVPKDKRVKPIDWNKASLEERQKYNEKYGKEAIYDKDIPRDDKILVKVVEKLEEKANGMYASLEVVEIPDGVEWEIEEYDGSEWIAEKHRTWR